MRSLLLLLLSFGFINFVFCQTDYDKQVENFAIDITKKLDGKLKKIAVVDFKNNDDDITQLSRLVADDLSGELAIQSNGKLEIVERNNLQRILDDLKLSSNKDESRIAKELGKKAYADVLITGIITLFGDNYRISIKILDTETGNIISASKGMVVKTSALENLHSKKIKQNDSESQHSTTSSNPKSTPVPVSSDNRPENGWLTIQNKGHYGWFIFISQDQTVLLRKATVWDETYVGEQSSDKIPSLKPGVYFVCICPQRDSQSCALTKKVEIYPGKESIVTLN